MTTDQTSIYGDVSGVLPTRSVDNAQRVARFDNYGGLFTQPRFPGLHALAEEGSLFEFHNTTLDLATTIAGHAAPVVADIDATFVKAFFFLRNAAGSGVLARLRLLALEIEVATAGANGTDSWWADETGSTTRYSSAGTALTVVNPNMQSTASLSSVATILAGPIVISAENSTTRKLGFGIIRPTIEVAGDKKLFLFGDTVMAGAQQVAAPAGRLDIIRRPPVILGSGDEYMLGLAGTAQSVAGVYKVRGLLAYC